MAKRNQAFLPGLGAPPDDPAVAQLRTGTAEDLEASLLRLKDIHRRMDEIMGAKP